MPVACGEVECDPSGRDKDDHRCTAGGREIDGQSCFLIYRCDREGGGQRSQCLHVKDKQARQGYWLEIVQVVAACDKTAAEGIVYRDRSEAIEERFIGYMAREHGRR